jgi:hypothetical protein
MLTRTRSWLPGLTLGLVAGAVLGAATVSRGAFGRGDADVQARLAALEALTRHLTVVAGPVNGLAGPHLILEGVNVHIRSGAGSSDEGTGATPGPLTGLGNLVIGYNAPPTDLEDGERGGSHTLIVGDEHRYLSWGGLVAGFHNTSRAPGTSVTGGAFNAATHSFAAVLGGNSNRAEGTFATVSGGRSNVAAGSAASVSGGFVRLAPNDDDWVAGALLQPN